MSFQRKEEKREQEKESDLREACEIKDSHPGAFSAHPTTIVTPRTPPCWDDLSRNPTMKTEIGNNARAIVDRFHSKTAKINLNTNK